MPGNPLTFAIIALAVIITCLLLVVFVLLIRMARPRAAALDRAVPERAASDQPTATPPPDRQWTATEYDLTRLSPDLAWAAWAGAVPHAFNAAVLLALAPDLNDRAEAAYAEVQKLSFVEATPDRQHCVHGPIRASMLAHLWRNTPDTYRAYSTLAAKYYSRVLYGERGALGELFYRYVLPVSRQPAVQIEWLYHLALADPEQAVIALRYLATTWQTEARFDDLDRLLRVLAEQVDAGRVTGHLRATLHYFKALAERRQNRVREALAHLELARREAGHDHPLLHDTLAAVSEAVDTLNRSEAVPHHDAATWAAYRVWVDRIGTVRRQWRWWDELHQIDRRDEALKHHQEMLEVYRASHNLLGEAHTARVMGDEYLLLERPGEALTWYEAALRLYVHAGNHFDEANTRRAIGDVHQFLNRHAEALTHYDGALVQYRALRARLSEADTLKAKGDALHALNRAPAAFDQYDEALSIYHDRGAALSEAAVLVALGHALHVAGRNVSAQTRYNEALQLYERHHDRLGEANTHLALGDQLRLTGQATEASIEYRAARQLYQQSRDRVGEANVLLMLGKAASAQDRGDEAVQQYAAALEYYRAVGTRLGEANALVALGYEYQRQHQTVAAQTQFDAALRHYAAIGQLRGEAEMHWVIGLELELTGQHAEAAVRFDLAAERYGQLSYLPGQAAVLLARGEQNLAGGDWVAAEQHLAAALILYEQVVDHAHQVQVLARLAEVQLALDQGPAAAATYTQAIGLSAHLMPARREAHGLRGLQDLAEGQFQSALPHFEAAAGREDRVTWQVGAGLARFALGQVEVARDILTRAWARANAHERAEARRWLAHVQRLKPELVVPPDELGLRD